MQSPVKKPTEGSRIEAEGPAYAFDLKMELLKCAEPFGLRPIVVREFDTKTRIADSVHETKRWLGEPSFKSMIFDEQVTSRHSSGFCEERFWIVGVMQDIHEHHGIHALVRVGKMESIKRRDFNGGLGSNQHVCTANTQVRSSLRELRCQAPVSAAHIEQ